MRCHCTELSYFRDHGFLLPSHDCEYIAWRNSFIPASEAEANKAVPKYKETIEDKRRWSGVFCREMERMVRGG